jgi:hypothetical protein
MAQDDDIQQVKRPKKHICNNTSQTAEKLTKPVPISTAVKLPPKAVLTQFFAPLRTTYMYMETIGAVNALSEQEAPSKPGRLPLIMMISTTNCIQLQSDLKDHIRGEYNFQNTVNSRLSRLMVGMEVTVNRKPG